MSSYLIFSLTYLHVFNGFSLAKNINYKFNLVQIWYPPLWKPKSTYHFYEVNNVFIYSFKNLIFGPNASRLSLEATSFLYKRGSFESMESFSVIILYLSHDKSSYLPYYVSDKIFVVEICNQYKFWDHFFNEKRKTQSIPLPWKIGEITIKGIMHLDDISN
jgi:hypothetical protein